VDADARGFPVGADESVNGRFRDECVNLEWFRSRAEARVVIENWRRHYNAVPKIPGQVARRTHMHLFPKRVCIGQATRRCLVIQGAASSGTTRDEI
jgi:putative transposase